MPSTIAQDLQAIEELIKVIIFNVGLAKFTTYHDPKLLLEKASSDLYDAYIGLKVLGLKIESKKSVL
jgi:hypothetical protein